MVTLYSLNLDMPKSPRPAQHRRICNCRREAQCSGEEVSSGQFYAQLLWIGNPSSKLSTLCACCARHAQDRSKDYESRSQRDQRDRTKSSLDTNHSLNAKSNRTWPVPPLPPPWKEFPTPHQGRYQDKTQSNV